MPSFSNPEIDKTDIVGGKLDLHTLGLSTSIAIEYLEHVKILLEKIKQKQPKVVSHPSFTKVPRFNLYCANEAIAIPYVSPMLAESLENLLPILYQVGDSERFLNSNILFSFRAFDPSKFQLPKYTTTNFANLPFKELTKVILEVYKEACHYFQSFVPNKITQFSIECSCDFIKNYILNKNTPNKAENKSFQDIPKAINAVAITLNCDVKELDEKFLECLKWKNIGIVPDLEVEA
ncbi:12202_t:CDS:2 [Racocetra persica]|uniref:12202_t:CDS:1 n=1 Tax=Racocetra persica TaxID=160502 RepID=A0ACA9QBQ8_9GLOM|nr:12202_t:CDS:2 [Racocetra persica]